MLRRYDTLITLSSITYTACCPAPRSSLGLRHAPCRTPILTDMRHKSRSDGKHQTCYLLRYRSMYLVISVLLAQSRVAVTRLSPYSTDFLSKCVFATVPRLCRTSLASAANRGSGHDTDLQTYVRTPGSRVDRRHTDDVFPRCSSF
jgi:hypothetical protein